MNLRRRAIQYFGCVLAISGGFSAVAQAAESVNLDAAAGKACWIEAYTNSAGTWTMTIVDGEATVAKLSGKGVDFAPMKVVAGSERFVVKFGAIAKFTSSTGKANVKFKTVTINRDTGDPAVFGNMIGGEDGDDDDWQDIIANITCLHHAG